MQILVSLLFYLLVLPVLLCSSNLPGNNDSSNELSPYDYASFDDFLFGKKIQGLEEDLSVTFEPTDGNDDFHDKVNENLGMNEHAERNENSETDSIDGIILEICNYQNPLKGNQPRVVASKLSEPLPSVKIDGLISLDKEETNNREEIENNNNNNDNKSTMQPPKYVIQDLLGNRPFQRNLSHGIKLIRGCFKTTYGSGTLMKNIHKISHGDSITILTPYFIATFPASEVNSRHPPLLPSCRGLIKPYSYQFKGENLILKSTKNHGIYAYIDVYGKFCLNSLPKHETLLIVRGTMIVNLRDNNPWTIQEGDNVIWIAQANIENLDQIIEVLKIAAQRGTQVLYDQLCEIFSGTEKAMTIFERVREDYLADLHDANDFKNPNYSSSSDNDDDDDYDYKDGYEDEDDYDDEDDYENEDDYDDENDNENEDEDDYGDENDYDDDSLYLEKGKKDPSFLKKDLKTTFPVFNELEEEHSEDALDHSTSSDNLMSSKQQNSLNLSSNKGISGGESMAELTSTSRATRKRKSRVSEDDDNTDHAPNQSNVRQRKCKTRPIVQDLFAFERDNKSKEMGRIYKEAKGYFPDVYAAGRRFSQLIVIPHGNRATIITPFFIVTTLVENTLLQKSFVMRTCLNTSKPIKNRKVGHCSILRVCKGIGIYAHMCEDRKLFIKAPPINETILVVNKKLVRSINPISKNVDPKEENFWLETIEQGDYLVWIPLPELVIGPEEMKQLVTSAESGAVVIFETIERLWKVKAAIMPFKAR